jgi:hypothetical protein
MHDPRNRLKAEKIANQTNSHPSRLKLRIMVLSLAKIPSGGKMGPGPEFSARFSDRFRLPRSSPVTAEHNENRTKRIAPGGGRTSPGGFPHLR